MKTIKCKKVIFLLVINFAYILNIYSQEILGSNTDIYYNFLALKDLNIERPALNYKTSSNNIWNSIDEEHESNTKAFKKLVSKDNLKFYIFYPELFNSYKLKQSIPFFNNIEGQLLIEINNFEISQDFQLQWPYIGYFGHGFVKQGYTNYGQILGAGTGQFGNSQFISYKIFYNKRYSSIFFHRYCPTNNYTYNKAVNKSANSGDSELNKNWYANFPTYLVIGTKNDSIFQINVLLNQNFALF